MNRTDLKRISALAVVTLATLTGLDWYSRANANQKKTADKPANKQKADKGKKQKRPLLVKFMRAKLTASSQVLEGLCTEDFDLITKGAKSLHKVSSAEKWRVSNDAMYRQQSLEFSAGVERLLKAAQAKKLDTAALAWTKTTLNCIECHRWLKARLITDGSRNE